jgi:hypothetical protein
MTKKEDDPYREAKSLGIYRILDSDEKLTADELAERIVKNRLKYHLTPNR